MIKRNLAKEVKTLATEFPVVAVIGPRQSGKTTLVKKVFHNYQYVSLEDPDILQIALDDPRAFFNKYSNKVIFDEIQKAPLLLSYLQGIVDNNNQPGQFVLTGSQNYLLMDKISQSLAGRVGITTLLPLSLDELSNNRAKTLEEQLFTGFYPRIYDQNIRPSAFYGSYISTYVEKDVRQILNIKNHNQFITFIRILAGRSGQELRIQSISEDTGISQNTIKSWLNVLETSFIIFRLQPHHKNYNKRLVKSPKIYFYDTGLLCYLLQISNHEDLIIHPLKGPIFETYVISEFIKANYHQNKSARFTFWRDNHQKEIDLLIENGQATQAIEIKSSKTINNNFFKNLLYWQKLTKAKTETLNLIYGGEESYQPNNIKTLGWNQFLSIIK